MKNFFEAAKAYNRREGCTGSDTPCGCYTLLSKEKTEIARLEATNAELLEALQKASVRLHLAAWPSAWEIADILDAAIAKGEA